MVVDRRCAQKSLLALILAGGRGKRLHRLTDEDCKPGMPVGKNRFIDFALANVVNSKIVESTMILTQYMQQSLIHHLGSLNLNSRLWGRTVDIVPAQQQLGDDSWYTGSANAVYQNHDAIRNDPADTVVILAADHIYKLDIRQMLAFHMEKQSAFTVCGISMPTYEAAKNFGVIELDSEARILGFEEKPAHPKTIPGREGICFASMGIYIVDKEFLLKVLEEDHNDPDSVHDFGKDIVPKLAESGDAIYGYDYNQNFIPGEVRLENGVEQQVHYWRDVGRIGPYWEAVMDLVAVDPYLNLYNPMWPVPTVWDMLPQAKFIFPDRNRYAADFAKDGEDCPFLPDAIMGGGCIFDSPRDFYKAVFGRSVRTGYGAEIRYSIIHDNVKIGERVSLTHTIVKKGVTIPAGIRIGHDLAEDAANGVYVDPDHDRNASYPPIRVVTKNTHFRRP